MGCVCLKLWLVYGGDLAVDTDEALDTELERLGFLMWMISGFTLLALTFLAVDSLLDRHNMVLVLGL